MLHPLSEEGAFKPLTGETIFEHIRKKAKNYPLPDELKSAKSKHCTLTEELFPENQQTFSHSFDMFEKAHSDQILQDNLNIMLPEPMKTIRHAIHTKVKHGLHSGGSEYEEVNSPPKVPRIEPKLFKLPSPSNFFVNKEVKFSPASSIGTNGKLCSPVLSRRLSCSSQTVGENREADCFLGFKSVFSFL